MRTLFLILLILAGLLGGGGAGVLAWRDFRDAGEMKTLEKAKAELAAAGGEQALSSKQKKLLALTPGTFYVGGAASLLLALAVLTMVVLTFRKQGGLPPLAAVLVVAIAQVALNPSWDFKFPASPQKIAVFAGLFSIISAAFAYGAHRAWLTRNRVA